MCINRKQLYALINLSKFDVNIELYGKGDIATTVFSDTILWKVLRHRLFSDIENNLFSRKNTLKVYK